MEIEIISFGKIAEFIGNQKIDIAEIADTDKLKIHLETLFPKLKDIKYKFALNNHLVQDNSAINHKDTLAIMPPFSGG
ncbi:MoaD/ThiS family protein [Pedobacter sp. HDW13]|uniref:MoaD/ThiS family protein n=1 Tax=unclassified Pedobacter TaxID=2628915 RepID=UPI000F59F745|nr:MULTISPECIES: MoaD/ThiS family protein [unclassified Pedobacter]QIL38042.1 MoaD/ThiS family protein [Pedobacter sp. HDW13]RQO69013.1 molybdopterin synthase sulfur carrier subunit [Pedobacter sp. KBW01]